MLHSRIRGTLLKGMKLYDYAGERLDNTLTFKQQINRPVSSCNKKLTLSRIKQFIQERVAVLIYKSLIVSKLTYGGVVFWSAQAKEIGKLQKTQNRALRSCYKFT